MHEKGPDGGEPVTDYSLLIDATMFMIDELKNCDFYSLSTRLLLFRRRNTRSPVIDRKSTTIEISRIGGRVRGRKLDNLANNLTFRAGLLHQSSASAGSAITRISSSC